MIELDVKAVRPLRGRLLVRRRPDQEETAGGILIPEIARRGHSRKPEGKGTIVAIGPGPLNDAGEEMPIDDLKVGDQICFSRLTGENIDGVDHLIVHYEEVLCVFEPE